MSIARDAAVDYADMVDSDLVPVGPIHPGSVLEEEFLQPLGLSGLEHQLVARIGELGTPQMAHLDRLGDSRRQAVDVLDRRTTLPARFRTVPFAAESCYVGVPVNGGDDLMARADPVTEEPPTLYDRDLNLWLEQQAILLRERRFGELDLANLVEEIDSMGRKDKKAIKSNLVIVLLHLLKHQFRPKRRSRSWLDSILEHRQRLRDDLAESPSLRGHLEVVLAAAYADARARAITQTGLSERAFPRTSPYTLEQALDTRFLPE